MDNGSGETVQDAQRGQNRQAEPGGEYFVYFWTGRGGKGTFARCAPWEKLWFFRVGRIKGGLCAKKKKGFKKILTKGEKPTKGKNRFVRERGLRPKKG
ncbi:hypothetical protein, partial [Klebsiella pneumoniae]|uniref:hypothetical protein n=1 Tax=Klebsiella pneumoniae TaxID=573 RepID=UPI001CDA9557